MLNLVFTYNVILQLLKINDILTMKRLNLQNNNRKFCKSNGFLLHIQVVVVEI